MVSFPPCKINLGLHILAKRADGYHAIETIFYSVPWTDVLEIIAAPTLSFASSGNSIPGKEGDNLCLKAFHLLKKDFDVPPVSIHLHKIIPTGAGLGGGSSDAAHTLRVLNELFQLKLTVTQLQHYAANLGSDCSFFIQDSAMIGSERGEVLAPVDVHLKDKFLLIVKPEMHVSTAEAYAGVIPHTPARSLKEVIALPMAEWKDALKNDFERTVFQSHPAIRSCKEEMYAMGAVYASMSGSGSSVFGLFDTPVKLPPAMEQLSHWSGLLP